jgi:hypothetical protein
MKSTASKVNTTTERQRKYSRQNITAGAAGSRRQPVNAAASASQQATARAWRGESPGTNSQSARLPKQEN